MKIDELVKKYCQIFWTENVVLERIKSEIMQFASWINDINFS
jgi:hypothetical protein